MVKLCGHEFYVLAQKRRAAGQRERHAAQAGGSLAAQVAGDAQEACPRRDSLLLRLGAARKGAGRAFGLVKIPMPPAGQAVANVSEEEQRSFDSTRRKLHRFLRRLPALRAIYTRFSDLTPIGPITSGLVRATSIGNPALHRTTQGYQPWSRADCSSR